MLDKNVAWPRWKKRRNGCNNQGRGVHSASTSDAGLVCLFERQLEMLGLKRRERRIDAASTSDAGLVCLFERRLEMLGLKRRERRAPAVGRKSLR